MILCINLRYHLVGSYEPGTLRLSDHTNAEHFFGFCLQVFCQAGPPQRVDYLASRGNKRRLYFPRTSSVRRIFERRGAGNLRIMKTKLKGLPSDSAPFSAQIICPNSKRVGHDSILRAILRYLCIIGNPKGGEHGTIPSLYIRHCQGQNDALPVR